ncbi:MAG: biopolymer transporter ExbD [Spirochaetes bacterium GWB1_48_6]|nr:MAG: biopolymer transporter ExbD [Spirochaetes bacterium GWB1_48_6]
MTLKRKRRTLPSVPISAMSDIGFLLLIFIMLVSLINYRQEVKIEYPEAQQIHKTQAEHNFEIWVNPQGGVFYKGKPLNSQELEALLVETYTLHPDQRIHIIADKNTPYVHLAGVMEILQLLQHRVVSLVIKES